ELVVVVLGKPERGRDRAQHVHLLETDRAVRRCYVNEQSQHLIAQIAVAEIEQCARKARAFQCRHRYDMSREGAQNSLCSSLIESLDSGEFSDEYSPFL